MKVFGVTAEFNPFHSGHRRLAEAARTEFGADFVVAVMSGNYVQRGTPAVFDKWKRAEQALDGGYDLVLELPAALAVRHGAILRGMRSISSQAPELSRISSSAAKRAIQRLSGAWQRASMPRRRRRRKR